MQRRLVVASAISVVVTAAFLPGSGVGSSAAAVRGAREIPAGLAAAIHARFGAGAIRSSSAAASTEPGPSLGETVSLSADGTTALVGAIDGWERGGAYIFRVANEAAWASTSAPTATLTNSGAHAGDGLGFAALSADGATAVIGAPEVRFETGAVDLFHASDASAWASSSTPTAILTNSALNRCVVPRLKGLTVRAAKARLTARSCRLGRVTRVHVTRGKRGRVIYQSRKPGTRPAVGTRVAVKVKK